MHKRDEFPGRDTILEMVAHLRLLGINLPQVKDLYYHDCDDAMQVLYWGAFFDYYYGCLDDWQEKERRNG